MDRCRHARPAHRTLTDTTASRLAAACCGEAGPHPRRSSHRIRLIRCAGRPASTRAMPAATRAVSRSCQGCLPEERSTPVRSYRHQRRARQFIEQGSHISCGTRIRYSINHGRAYLRPARRWRRRGGRAGSSSRSGWLPVSTSSACRRARLAPAPEAARSARAARPHPTGRSWSAVVRTAASLPNDAVASTTLDSRGQISSAMAPCPQKLRLY
jgi:hypothetical protein